MPRKRKTKKPRRTTTVDRGSELNELATALVRGWYAVGWKFRDRLPDYHVDYDIERVDQGELSGAIVYAQQKAHETVKPLDGMISQPMETKHLRYYAEKLTVPVFVLVVDVGAKQAWFLFLQEAIDQGLGAKLRKQKWATVKVPVENRLDDVGRFAGAVTKALHYMKEKHPASVNAAIAKDVKEVEATDSRFAVKLDFVDGQKRYELAPKEPVNVKLTVSGENAAKLQDAYEYGRSVELSGPDIQVHGLPGAQRNDGKVAGLSITAVPRRCDLHFWAEPPGETFRLVLDGGIVGGAKGVMYLGELRDSPLRIEIKLPPRPPEGETTATMNFQWDWSKWEGKPIQALAYFAALRDFTDAVLAGRTVSYEFAHEGKRMIYGTLTSLASKDPFEFAAALIRDINLAREAAKYFGVHPLLPPLDRISKRDYFDLDFASAIATKIEFKRKGAGMDYDVTIDAGPGIETKLREFEAQPPGNFRLVMPDQPGAIFGTEVNLGAIEHVITSGKIVVPDETWAVVGAGIPDSVKIKIVGTAETMIVMRRAVPEPTEEPANSESS